MTFSRPAREALDLRTNPNARWARAESRIARLVQPELRPRFTLDAGSKVFTIGSCFARNVERHLDRYGFDVPTLRFSAPPEESNTPTGILNKYTPPTIFQEFDWVARVLRDGGVNEANTGVFMHPADDGKVIDINLSGLVPVSRERFFERRRQLAETTASVVDADCVVITLGYIESWYDTKNDIYLQSAPLKRQFPDQDRYQFQVLDYRASLDFAARALDVVRKLNSAAKFLITVSPVPLGTTFAENDVIIENSYSKSVLRAVCGELYYRFEDVDYFPSYEMVMQTKSWEIWNHDRIHVTEATISRIVGLLARNYFTNIDTSRDAYERSYRALGDGELDEAMEGAREAVAVAPGNPDFRAHLAFVLFRGRNYEEAAAEARAAVALDPDLPFSRFVLAKALEALGRDGEAVEEARLAFETFTSFEGVLSHPVKPMQFRALYAGLATRTGRHDVAISLWQDFIGIARRHRKAAYVNLVAALRAAGREAEAETVRREAAGQFPDAVAVFQKA